MRFCRFRWRRLAGHSADQRQGFCAAWTQSLPALYRNNHNGTFTDITRGSGLDVEMYGMGVAVADYDNDGLPDVYITALEGDRLFHNEGHGHFRDVTAASGIHNANFGTSAAWFDYDQRRQSRISSWRIMSTGARKTISGARWMARRSPIARPNHIKERRRKLYHNLGNGKFEDVTAEGRLWRCDQ